MVTRPATKPSRKPKPKSEPKPESHLIDNLHIEGYRCFEKYTVRDLRRVNLFVGPNNCGKTALLEAAYLLFMGGYLDSAAYLLSLREGMPLDRYEDQAWWVELSHLLTGLRVRVGSDLQITTKDGWVSWEVRSALHGFEDDPKQDPGHLMIKARYRNAGAMYGLPITDSRVVLNPPQIRDARKEDAGEQKERHAFFPPRTPEIRRQLHAQVCFIPASGLESDEIIALWEEMQKSGEEAAAIKAIKLIDSRIQSLTILAGGERRESLPSSAIYIGMEGLQGRQPLSNLGFGTQRLFEFGTAIAAVSGGKLLIDEVDTGIHYSKMGPLWQFLVESAHQFDVQVFASTHSLDCVRGLGEALNESPAMIGDVAVHKMSRRLDHSVPFYGDTLISGLENDIELRG